MAILCLRVGVYISRQHSVLHSCAACMTTYVQQANERNGTLLQEVDYPENCQAHEESSIISSALNLIFAFVYIRRAKCCMNSVIKRVKFLLKCFKFVSR